MKRSFKRSQLIRRLSVRLRHLTVTYPVGIHCTQPHTDTTGSKLRWNSSTFGRSLVFLVSSPAGQFAYYY